MLCPLFHGNLLCDPVQHIWLGGGHVVHSSKVSPVIQSSSPVHNPVHNPVQWLDTTLLAASTGCQILRKSMAKIQFFWTSHATPTNRLFYLGWCHYKLGSYQHCWKCEREQLLWQARRTTVVHNDVWYWYWSSEQQPGWYSPCSYSVHRCWLWS